MPAATIPVSRMPAEWEPHRATWIAWPHHAADWPGKFAAIPWVYAEIVRHLAASETVCLLVADAKMQARARRLLRRAGIGMDRIEFYQVPTDRVWTRDYCPIFVVGEKGDLALTDWHFNGWAKYPNWQRDDAVAGRVAELLGRPIRQPVVKGKRVVLEGGSIDVNGQGLLLTTEECLLGTEQARNPDLTQNALEKLFCEFLGIKKVLWLNRGIAGDDTHGHVDDLARFVNPRTVAIVTEDDPEDENYLPLQENLERLKGMTDQEGRPLEVVTLPMPDPVMFAGTRLPASYANFYIANDRVLVPTFNDPMDRVALGTLAELFPDRTVVGIHAVDLVWGLGTLHCLTQQEPASDHT
ncbi:MAG TPA: agmatine deiminase family protein [Gemmataceae bacterium]|nr:agmatine deiminase family protein [Gemmataceae bacterium]